MRPLVPDIQPFSQQVDSHNLNRRSRFLMKCLRKRSTAWNLIQNLGKAKPFCKYFCHFPLKGRVETSLGVISATWSGPADRIRHPLKRQAGDCPKEAVPTPQADFRVVLDVKQRSRGLSEKEADLIEFPRQGFESTAMKLRRIIYISRR